MDANAMRIARRLSAVFIVLAAFCSPAFAAGAPQVIPDIVYGHKDGMALTLDLLKPAKPNGAAIVQIISGGWYSTWFDPRSALPVYQPFLDKGFTVFIVRHGSAPRYTVPDAVEDVRRSIRFLHLHEKDLGIDANRIGVTGGSAGGHLTLMLATTADAGDPKSPDPVLRQSDRIAAADALFPPTDLRGWTTNPPDVIKGIPMLKPPLTFDAAKEVDLSPLLHVTAATAPTLLIHGDKDTLVPIEHSRKMLAALEKEHVVSKLLVIEGGGHGFGGKQNDEATKAMLEWFEQNLIAKK